MDKYELSFSPKDGHLPEANPGELSLDQKIQQPSKLSNTSNLQDAMT